METKARLSTTMGAQGLAKIFKPVDKNVKEYKVWEKSIEKYT